MSDSGTVTLRVWTKISPSWEKIKAKRFLYWAWVAVLIGLGIFAGILLEDKRAYLEARYWYSQKITQLLPGEPTVNDIGLIVIGDDEYWKGELGRRVPIKRSYLAELVKTVAKFNPSVIALDFDFRSPVSDGSMIEHPDYEQETKQLGKADLGRSQAQRTLVAQIAQ